MPDDEIYAYLKTNVSADLPYLIREAAKRGGFANSADWVRAHLVAALAREVPDEVPDADDLLRRQPHWGNGRGATSPEYIARRYGKPWPPESAGSGNKSSEKVSQGG